MIILYMLSQSFNILVNISINWVAIKFEFKNSQSFHDFLKLDFDAEIRQIENHLEFSFLSNSQPLILNNFIWNLSKLKKL